MNLPHTTTPGLLLGFTGRAGSGKDTCAEILRAHGFVSLAFADALRTQVAEAFRLDPRMLTDRDTKEWPIESLALARCSDQAFVRAASATGPENLSTLDEAVNYAAWLAEPRSPRWIMQRWGTEYRRALDSRYWLDIGARWVGAQRWQAVIDHRPALLCITDVRFPNEGALIRALGGYVVQVHRPDLPELDDTTAAHASEQTLPSTVVVHNDGNLEHLHAELLRVLRQLAPDTAPA